MGEIEQGLIRQAKMAGEPIPERIASKPILSAGDLPYYMAFIELDTERSHSFSLAKVPRSAIVAFANECGLNNEERDDLIFIIRIMDAAHLEYLAKKREK
jgi:hypothetical protein